MKGLGQEKVYRVSKKGISMKSKLAKRMNDRFIGAAN